MRKIPKIRILLPLIWLAAIPALADAPTPAAESLREIRAILSSAQFRAKLAPNDVVQDIQRILSGYRIATSGGCVVSVTVTSTPLQDPDDDAFGELQLQFFPNERCLQ
jgi:hypothetical protein